MEVFLGMFIERLVDTDPRGCDAAIDRSNLGLQIIQSIVQLASMTDIGTLRICS